MNSEHRVDRLKDVLAEMKRKGYKSYASIERNFDVSASFLSQVINGVVPLGETAARNMETKIGLPAFYLDKNVSDKSGDDFFTTDGSTDIKEFHTDYNIRRIKNENDTNIAVYSNIDFVSKTEYDFVGVKYHIEIPKRFFGKHDVEPRNFRMITNDSNSMKPYINKSDDVGVDISQTDVSDGELYLLSLDGDVMIKQVFREGGGSLRLHSFNADYPDRLISKEDTDNLVIIGKQMYRAG